VPDDDVVAAYLRFLPHTPYLNGKQEQALGRRIAFGMIRMRWAVSHCEVVHRAVISIAQQVLSGFLQPKEVVDWSDQKEIRQHFSLILQLSGEPLRLSHMIRRTPFLDCYWQTFINEIRSAAPQDAALRLRLYQALRSRRDVEEAAEALVQANLRPAAGYAIRYLDRGLELQDLVRAARLGLMRAAHTYDHRSEKRFLSHARPFIFQACEQARDRTTHPTAAQRRTSGWVN
jgi:hypothetical protein